MYFYKTLLDIMEKRELDKANLSKLCNIETSLIEQLLDGTIAPSSSTIFKISRALNIPIELLIDEQEGADCEVITQKEQVSISENQTSLSPNKPMRNMDPIMVTLDSKKPIYKTAAHEGEEFAHIIDGEVVLTLGDDKKTMNCGDSIYFDTIISHSFELKGESAKILTIIYRPL